MFSHIEAIKNEVMRRPLAKPRNQSPRAKAKAKLSRHTREIVESAVSATLNNHKAKPASEGARDQSQGNAGQPVSNGSTIKGNAGHPSCAGLTAGRLENAPKLESNFKGKGAILSPEPAVKRSKPAQQSNNDSDPGAQLQELMKRTGGFTGVL